MRRLAFLAVLVALVAGAAFAQQDMGNTPTSGATYTTGVVEQFDTSALTLREDSNQVVTILIDKGTVGADHPLLGSRVRVNFRRNERNQMIAIEIQGLAGAKAQAAAVVHTTPVLPTEPAPEPVYAKKPVYTPEPAPMPAPAVEPAATLPRGASPLAAIGLVGLLAMGGALALRFKS